jgi:ribosome-binding protein aMBF1 (putative translation factor)
MKRKAKFNGAKAVTPKKVSKPRRGLGRMERYKQPARRKEVSNIVGRFGRYITKRREQKGMTIRQFAEHVKMPFSNIFQFEQLRKNPRLTELEELAQALNEPLGTFMEPLLWPEPTGVLAEPTVNIV